MIHGLSRKKNLLKRWNSFLKFVGPNKQLPKVIALGFDLMDLYMKDYKLHYLIQGVQILKIFLITHRLMIQKSLGNLHLQFL